MGAGAVASVITPVGMPYTSTVLAKNTGMRRRAALMGNTPYLIARFAPVYTDDDRHDIQKRFYLKFPSLAFVVGKGVRYTFLDIRRAVHVIPHFPDGLPAVGQAHVVHVNLQNFTIVYVLSPKSVRPV